METKRRLTLVINPISGTSRKRGVSRLVTHRLAQHGFEVETAYTRGPGDATRIAREAAARGDYGVIACGGDGTVNETACGLIDTRTALGILPAGSGNGLARHIGIPIDILHAVKVIALDHVDDCDYCDVNGRPFFCTFGMGYDAAVSYNFARRHRRGLMTYLGSAIDEFVKFHPAQYAIRAGGRAITDKAFAVVCCNASQYGNNAFIAPAASIRDGLIDVTVIHSGNPLTRMITGLELIWGTIGNHGIVETFRVPSLTIERTLPGIAHIDGEPITLPQSMEVTCHPGRLRIFTTLQKKPFKPLVTPINLFLSDVALNLSRIFDKD